MDSETIADHRRDVWAIPGLSLLELDENGTITGATSALCELLGRSGPQVLGHDPAEFTHPDDVAAVNQSVTVAHHGAVAREIRYLRPDGTVIPVLLNAVSVRQGRIVGHVTDLSATVAASEAAARIADRYSSLVEHSADPIFAVNCDGRLITANAAAFQLVGNRIGQSAATILQELVHPDDVGPVLGALKRSYTRAGFHEIVTFRLKSQDGNWVWLEANANNQLADPVVRALVITARDVSLTTTHLEQTRAMMRSMIAALVRATEFRDPYTAGHQLKVADISERIARQLGLPQADCELIELGASVHDIGKIAIPAEILGRPGALSPLEFEMVKTHCRIGYDILADAKLPHQITDIVLHHHERLDGSGYPDGLAGDAISLEARIVSVADVIDAMASHRPYRAALGIEAARTEIQRGRGLRYDPAVVDVALAITAEQPALPGPPTQQQLPPSLTTDSPLAASGVHAA
ncbi:MAG TPA: HD domain-containing phosphohydrolase [Acidothermaceae bacterium]|nr:HD domain-containing phosphohydrolase [Acidothermaceae bacterium]